MLDRDTHTWHARVILDQLFHEQTCKMVGEVVPWRRHHVSPSG